MPSKQEVDAILSEPVCIIGAGPTGLITAHTLLQDGFKNVQIFTKDEDVGGVWSKKRVYPGLVLNNVHGQFNFSPLPMPAGARYDERLTGDEISAYMEVFAQMYVKDKIQFGVEVLNLRHVIEGEKSQWVVKMLHKKTGLQEEKVFRRVVLCSGGCSTPTMPSDISPSVAESAGFSGLVFHTSDFKERIDQVLQVVGPKGSGGGADGYAGSVVIVGGGRSAQDIATYLAKAGRQVTMLSQDRSRNPASTALEVGIAQEAYLPQNKFNHEWDHYRTLANPPPLQPEARKWIAPIYRGIVPAKNILRRDLAVNGASASLVLCFLPGICKRVKWRPIGFRRISCKIR
ncbi:FAD/NAD(P)-binding domain-containing protein [Pluteus cervinus]|uniref:FAD/NAD(P)-binding domain-containing protein n=1 Tax=Pluteus cervinus TaxID=181527 RepID=A0ACD3A5U2_9AGAR|nr:FAD/NAD(P)-binding domain-containing protein [Pluteus cervinus]